MEERLSVFLLFSVLVFQASDSRAEISETSSDVSFIETDRNWTITIPLWIPGYRGQFAIGDLEVGGESPGGLGVGRLFASDVKINFFFMGSFAYEWGRWRVDGDVFGGEFTDDVTFTPADTTVVSASVRPVIPSLRFEHWILDHSWGESAFPQRVRGWVYAGVRYYDVRVEVDVSVRTESLTGRWADPIVGARIPVDLSSHWWFELSGDVGGFGLGSTFCWSAYAGLNYRIGKLVSLMLAYNILGVDYSGTVGSEEFRWNARVGGPGFGIRFTF
jgi:hypothetical protein